MQTCGKEGFAKAASACVNFGIWLLKEIEYGQALFLRGTNDWMRMLSYCANNLGEGWFDYVKMLVTTI